MIQILHLNKVLQLDEFINATTFREQVVLLAKELRSDELSPICSYKEIATILNIKMHTQLRTSSLRRTGPDKKTDDHR
jgi:hypothetical protein